jgi:4-hydroxy-tetrahydrodipicolinate reductase
LAASRVNIQLVGAVDIDPEKVGQDLGKVAGLEEELGVVITDEAAVLLAGERPQVVFHTTGSSIRSVHGQIAAIIEVGANVVSSCEELSFPHETAPDLAADLDRRARERGVSVLATGINPGFLMDTWPLFMTGVCQEVTAIRAVRVQDATSRRLPFQQKIGAGLSPDEFQRRVEAGTLRHVGLPESVAMVAAGLGWRLDGISESIEPVLAGQEVRSPHLAVKPGQAVGVKQVARGRKDSRDVITLEFQAAIGTPEPHDSVIIEGTPNLEVVIRGGTHGDIGTAAMVVNAAPRVVEAPPGFLTMKDLPPVVCAGRHQPGEERE